MKTIETASERYRQTLQSYKHHLQEVGPISLSAYCRHLHINNRGMRQWMACNKISVKSIKTDLAETIQSVLPQTSNSFVEIIPQEPISTFSSTQEQYPIPLEGISFTFSDGTILQIGTGSPEAITSIAIMYKKATISCLD